MNMPVRPVTIGCTTFNRSMQLHRTLWSLNAQDYPKDLYRVIVVDDGSVDDTQEVMKSCFDEFPELNLVNILTQRKPMNYHGGQGIALNLGIRYALDYGSDYVFLTGGDILIPTYGLSKHLDLHTNAAHRAWVIAEQVYHDPDPNTRVQNMLSAGKIPDVICGPQQYFIRPDRESLGNNQALLATIPDRYDWKPPEKLLLQPEATTLEHFPGQDHIYIGWEGQQPCDRTHYTWPTWQSCKTKHWDALGGWNEAGTGSLWEDEDLQFRFIEYQKHLVDEGLPGIEGVTHPEVQIYHQPHPRQISFDQRELLRESRKNHPYKANVGTEWGRAEHIIVEARW
jgi:glycosyltransferase involved in cell wall biosynthesis